MAQKHLDKFTDFIDRQELDHEYEIMRAFAQSFIGEIKKWFISLNVGSIQIFDQF